MANKDCETTAELSPPDIESQVVTTLKQIHVVLAGKQGAGKSNMASSLFGLEKEMKLSPDPVTTICTTEIKEKNGVTLHITDTRGLQQKGNREELKKISKHTKTGVDLLVYCISVDPACKFADGNPDIMRSLKEAFGKEIWKHCILIFTFSNRVWEWYEKNKKNAREHERIRMYEEFLRQYAEKFAIELKKMRVQHVDVETVFTLNLDPPQAGRTTIPAIPAGDNPEDCVMPRFEQTRIRIQDQDHPRNERTVNIDDWRDAIFVEIVKKCTSEVQRGLLQYRYYHDIMKIMLQCIG